MTTITDILWYCIIKACVNPHIVYRHFRAIRQLNRGQITDDQAYMIIYGAEA